VRGRPALVACALAVAATVGAGAWRLPGVFRATDDAVAQVRGLSRTERTLVPARSFDLDTDLYVAAAGAIPPGATYAFVSGPASNASSDVVLAKAPVFAGYWLLPRRLVGDADEADWIVSYGGDLKALGLRYRRIVDVSPGFQLAEVAR
jgi:hypothetical protein